MLVDAGDRRRRGGPDQEHQGMMGIADKAGKAGCNHCHAANNWMNMCPRQLLRGGLGAGSRGNAGQAKIGANIWEGMPNKGGLGSVEEEAHQAPQEVLGAAVAPGTLETQDAPQVEVLAG